VTRALDRDPEHDRIGLGFDTLPTELEAAGPAEARGLARDEVRLLVADRNTLTHARFHELPDVLRPGDLIVVNNSATLPAAVDATVAGRIAVLHFATRLDDGRWVAELRSPAGVPWPERPAAGTSVRLPDGAGARLSRPWLPPATRLWVLDTDADVPTLLSAHGRPISYAYLRQRWSASYYRTVFGHIPGSAEMPSAARPFTEHLVTELVSRGIGFAPITLHTGVSSPEIGEPPSPEWFEVPAATARLVNATKDAGARVIAVGTTVTRALETVADGDRVRPGGGWTELVLSADRPARAVDGLITGWHAPGASHLELLEAVAGTDTVRAAYAAAVATRYLWHEFGDSALLLR
jgi:S-adenosylmethionine:tRNA ribosyltransferase-isomerase